MLAASIQELVSIKIKPRHDGITDQYNRIFMVKICLICAAIIGVNYFSDGVSCIVANGNGMDGAFVGSACWIQGFYIFEEMKTRLDQSGYYGIPRNMDYDGINPLGQLCTTSDRALDPVEQCAPMEKVFYLQYQYMPFFVASLALLFYVPYLAFTFTNADLVLLKDYLKAGNVDSDDLLKKFFDQKKNRRKKMRYRVFSLLLVKLMYLSVNVVALLACHVLLHHKFLTYGRDYLQWTDLDHNLAHEHNLRERHSPKPGNALLPPMGLCEIHEASRDVRNTHVNQHKFICEVSPHVLYQYVLLVLWFGLVIGIVVSVIGVLMNLFGHLLNFACFMSSSDPARRMYRAITLREIDYLEYIRRNNMPIYVELLRKIRDARSITFKGKEKYGYTGVEL